MPGIRKNSGISDYAKKSFGQHFLRDQSVIDRILSAVDLNSIDVVVEVGPGRGALTEPLYRQMGEKQRADRLVLVEWDRDLLEDLQTRFPLAHIIHADAAQVDWRTITAGKSWIMLGNLPYNAGTAIVSNALHHIHPPKEMVVMLQKEVGERMLAKPGEMSLLSVAIQLMADVRRVCAVKPGAFVPPPQVDSIVLHLTLSPKIREVSLRDRIMVLARWGFAHPRKYLISNLKESMRFEDLQRFFQLRGLSEKVRAQELSIEDWMEMVKSV